MIFRFKICNGFFIEVVLDTDGFLVFAGGDILGDLFATDVEGNIYVDGFRVLDILRKWIFAHCL